MTRRTVALALGLGLLTVGCGGKSSHSTGPTAQAESPIIRGWEASRNAQTLVLKLDTYDPQGDLVGGTVYISGTINGQAYSDSFRLNLLPGSTAGDPENDAFVWVSAPAGYVIRSGVPVTFTTYVVDRAGHASNSVSGSFVTEEPTGSTGPAATTLRIDRADVGSK